MPSTRRVGEGERAAVEEGVEVEVGGEGYGERHQQEESIAEKGEDEHVDGRIELWRMVVVGEEREGES